VDRGDAGSGAGAGGGAPILPDDRRTHLALREQLDELIGMVRVLSHRAQAMSAGELEYAQRRLEWLADEIWNSVLKAAKEREEQR
jgi:hypothetical protein